MGESQGSTETVIEIEIETLPPPTTTDPLPFPGPLVPGEPIGPKPLPPAPGTR